MKSIIASSILSFCCISFSLAESITEIEKSEFISYYRKQTKLSEEFPENQEVKAIFIDVDGDGHFEALATHKGGVYEDGCIWSAYRKSGEEWTKIRGFNNRTKEIGRGSSIFARPGEVFRVVKNDGTIDFLILSENFDKQAPDGLGPLRKAHFSLDKEGVLRQDDIPDLERYLAYGGQNHSGLFSKMEVVPVEIFNVKAAGK